MDRRCPLQTQKKYDGEILNLCLRSGCAWYDRIAEECHVVLFLSSEVKTLKLIEKSFKKVMLKEESTSNNNDFKFCEGCDYYQLTFSGEQGYCSKYKESCTFTLNKGTRLNICLQEQGFS